MSQLKTILVVAFFLVGLTPTATSQATVAYSISFTDGLLSLDVGPNSGRYSSNFVTNEESRFEFSDYLKDNENITYTNNDGIENNQKILYLTIKVEWSISNWTYNNNFSMNAFGLSKSSSEQSDSMQLTWYVNENLTVGPIVTGEAQNESDFESSFFRDAPSLSMSFDFSEGTSVNFSEVYFEVTTKIVTWDFPSISAGGGIDCTGMVIANEGQNTIDVDVSMSGSGVTISPGAVSVTLAPGGSTTEQICVLASVQSSYKTVQVSAIAQGRESNTQLNSVNKNAGFAVILAPYASLSVSGSPEHNLCNETSVITFTVVNNGNYQDTVAVQIGNLQELEEAGFKLALLKSQYLIDTQGEQPVLVSVDSTNVSTKSDSPLTLNVSTTLAGESTSAEYTTIMKFADCKADTEDSKREQNTDNESDLDDDYEGDEVGECSDDADNDRDGLFDCDDDTCAGSSSCKVNDLIEEDSQLPSFSLLAIVTVLGIISMVRRK